MADCCDGDHFWTSERTSRMAGSLRTDAGGSSNLPLLHMMDTSQAGGHDGMSVGMGRSRMAL